VARQASTAKAFRTVVSPIEYFQHSITQCNTGLHFDFLQHAVYQKLHVLRARLSSFFMLPSRWYGGWRVIHDPCPDFSFGLPASAHGRCSTHGRVGITGGLGVGPPVQFATPRSIFFMNWGVGSNPPSWPQLSVYSCTRAPTTLVLAKQYVSRQTSVK
jgi:hypothetical protein